MILTQEQRERIYDLYDNINHYKDNVIYEPVKLEELFQSAPKGDFTWDEGEAGDWNIYSCDDDECDVGWHLIAYSDSIGRKDGRLFVEINSVDEDGNWEYCEGWEEGEDFTEIGVSMARRLDDYFSGWAEYYLYCAEIADDILEKGRDPVGDVITLPEEDEIVDFFIKAAEDKVTYLLS